MRWYSLLCALKFKHQLHNHITGRTSIPIFTNYIYRTPHESSYARSIPYNNNAHSTTYPAHGPRRVMGDPWRGEGEWSETAQKGLMISSASASRSPSILHAERNPQITSPP